MRIRYAAPAFRIAALCCLLPLLSATGAWVASPEVIPSMNDADVEAISGIVFEDVNGDGKRQPSEPGVPGVKVSNGLDVVVTDAAGAYTLTVRPDMDLTVVQPSGWRVPVNEQMAPRFFYTHKRGGSPGDLRFGGLPDTGPAPERVNFPLKRKDSTTSFTAAVIGDSQTYSNMEVSYFRDSAIKDLLELGEKAPDFMLYVGDVLGDDLGLLPRLLEVGASVGVPQWLVHGNHDLDFDAQSDDDSSDSWRRLYGPNYYAFEEGDALFVVLDNVVYPCGDADMDRPGREFCNDPDRPTYNGRVPELQMHWLRNLLAHTPEDRIVVFAHHIPFVSFVDTTSTKHQTDNLLELYSLVSGLEALSLSGHTHTIENHSPGQMFDGWDEAVGISELPFRHIVAGAASGSWYNGDLNYRGVPMSLQRMGAPKGVLLMEFDGVSYNEYYLGGGVPADQVMWIGLNTPRFRDWFDQLIAYRGLSREKRDTTLPPVNINDLGDNNYITHADLQTGVWLTANVWTGSSESVVSLSLNSGSPVRMERTQQGKGEAAKVGAEWADPFAAQRQLSVARVALRSNSGIERNQGYEAFKGSRFGPAAPQPTGSVADRNMHLWRYQLPVDLPAGVHTATVTHIDRHGRIFKEAFLFEVGEQLPPLRWRHELWQ